MDDTCNSIKVSYEMKSFAKAKHVVLEGALWKIGDGKKVKLWEDQWYMVNKRHVKLKIMVTPINNFI